MAKCFAWALVFLALGAAAGQESQQSSAPAKQGPDLKPDRDSPSPAPLAIKVHLIGREADEKDRPCFVVACTALNISKTRRDFWVWSCSRWDNWMTDTKAVKIKTWTCRGNFPYADFLEPGETLVDRLTVTLESGVRKDGVSFRLGFVPEVPDKPTLEFFNGSVAVKQGLCPPSVSPLEGTFWSDKVTITPGMFGKAMGMSPDLRPQLQRLEDLQKERRSTSGHVMRQTGG